MTKAIAILPGAARPLLEPRLPDWIEPRWFMSHDDAFTMAPGAEIGWLDMIDKSAMAAAISPLLSTSSPRA